MSIGDRYLLTLRGEHLPSGSANQNAFVYEMTAGLGGADQLNNAFSAGIVPLISAVTSDQYNMIDEYTINLDDPADFDTLPESTTGGTSGDYLPIFNAWEFEYTRTTRAINNGRKSIGIIPENLSTNGEATSGALTNLGTLATALQGVITSFAGVATFTNCQITGAAAAGTA
jgi:hypothetical protein